MEVQKLSIPSVRNPASSDRVVVGSESCNNTGLASPIMGALPLATRCAGFDSARPASAALHSSWIQRLRPKTASNQCVLWTPPSSAPATENNDQVGDGASNPVDVEESERVCACDGMDSTVLGKKESRSAQGKSPTVASSGLKQAKRSGEFVTGFGPLRVRLPPSRLAMVVESAGAGGVREPKAAADRKGVPDPCQLVDSVGKPKGGVSWQKGYKSSFRVPSFQAASKIGCPAILLRKGEHSAKIATWKDVSGSNDLERVGPDSRLRYMERMYESYRVKGKKRLGDADEADFGPGFPLPEINQFGRNHGLLNFNTWHPALLDLYVDADRRRAGGNEKKILASPPSIANLDVGEDTAKGNPHTRKYWEAIEKPLHQVGSFNRYDGQPKKTTLYTYQGVGGPKQQLLPSLLAPYQPYQYQHSSAAGTAGLPFSPVIAPFIHSEGSLRDEGFDNIGGKEKKSHSKPPFHQDRVNNIAKADSPMFTTLFSSYKESDQATPAPLAPASPMLPPRMPRGYKTSYNARDFRLSHDTGQQSLRNEVNLTVLADAQGHRDNQSSHLSSSPWPGNESVRPDEDGSALRSQGSQTAFKLHATVAEGVHSQGENGRFKGNSVCESDALHRQKQAIEGGLPRSEHQAVDIQAKCFRDALHANKEDQVVGASKPLKQLSLKSCSDGRINDSSGSSPPSLPPGYNKSSEICSPLFTDSAGNNQNGLASKHTIAVDVESENFVPKSRNARLQTFDDRKQQESQEYSANKDYAGQRNDLRGFRVELNPLETETKGSKKNPDFPARVARLMTGGEVGQKHGRMNNVGEVGEPAVPMHTKRIRHDGKQSVQQNALQAEEVHVATRDATGLGTEKSWLQRWITPSNGSNGKQPNLLGKPKDSTGKARATADGMTDKLPSSNHVTLAERSSLEPKKGFKDFRMKRSVLHGLPPISVASVEAMALLSTVTRKVGPVPPQRKGSLATYPSIPIYTPPEQG